MIPLYFNNGVAYVWNANDWYELRTKYRICGCFVGALPSHPRQNNFLGLPLELMAEETALLLEKNICELFELMDLTKPPTESQIKQEEALQKKLLEEQIEALRQQKIEQLSQKIDIIVAGKRKKLKSKGVPDNEIVLNKEDLLQEEISKLPPISPANLLVHQPAEYQFDSEKRKVGIHELKPSITDGEGHVRYKIFKDLWEKGHYINSGIKFGADFLVYPGDPVRFHAMYMVRCIDNSSTLIRPPHIVAFGRLSVAVNKLAVLASCNEHGEITYQTLQWHESVNG